MIFEMRTYRLQPRSVPEVEKRFGEALTERVKVSPLGARARRFMRVLPAVAPMTTSRAI
jgi:hypothetical protein